MKKKALLIVLDSVGCGNAPDAADYGDEGTNTLGHLLENFPNLNLENLSSLGLAELLGVNSETNRLLNSRCFRLSEQSAGKDTTTGHWELMNRPVLEAFFTCERFPDELVGTLEERCGVSFIGNRAASGTVILDELGEEHIRSGNPILYTSADSVLQIAAHEEIFGLGRLYEVCEIARKLLDEREIRVGRVIARPFLGNVDEGFQRTGNRHDYSLTPEGTTLNKLEKQSVRVIGIGKISDIFAGSGITESHPTGSNAEGMMKIEEILQRDVEKPEFIFANLVDFDSLYGHRRDPEGYARCLEEFDRWLGTFLPKVDSEVLVIITADHGNDPYHSGTDHTREQVPCMVISEDFGNIPEMEVFSDVGQCVERYFG